MFLQKPFTTTVLAQKVREMLDAAAGPAAPYPGGGPQPRPQTAGPSAGPALSPKDWCERILTSLARRNAQGAGVPYLHMVLTYFVELNPAPDAFAERVQEATADLRPRMAAAARVL